MSPQPSILIIDDNNVAVPDKCARDRLLWWYDQAFTRPLVQEDMVKESNYASLFAEVKKAQQQ